MKTKSVHTRQLSKEDWKLLRDMRLKALKECETMYLGSYQDALTFDNNRWHKFFEGNNKAIFGLFDNTSHIGIGGVYTSQNDPSGKTGILVMGFITPEYRRQGLSYKLYETRIDWAKKHPIIEKLYASHREGNEASRKAMIAHGFKPDRKERIHFGDGQEDTDYQYVLNLKK